jgi:hypothetical protein
VQFLCLKCVKCDFFDITLQADLNDSTALSLGGLHWGSGFEFRVSSSLSEKKLHCLNLNLQRMLALTTWNISGTCCDAGRLYSRVVGPWACRLRSRFKDACNNLMQGT